MTLPQIYVPNGLSGYIRIPLSSLTEPLSQLFLHCSLKASPHLQIVYTKDDPHWWNPSRTADFLNSLSPGSSSQTRVSAHINAGHISHRLPAYTSGKASLGDPTR